MANEAEMTKKFVDMTKEFRTKADGLMNEITSAFGVNLESAVKNYVDMQSTYLNGYTGISNGAQKANVQLLESMDKNFGELKTNINQLYTETQTKANQAIDAGSTDFKTQCEEILKKFPMLPESAYKETLKAITDSKGRVNSVLDKQYKDVLGKLDKNFTQTKKELTLPELKIPKIPVLDLAPSALDHAKGALTSAMTSMAVKAVAQNLAGTSKDAKK